MKSSGPASTTSTKSNPPPDPIFIDEDEEETLDFTPLQIHIPHSESIKEDDAFSEGEAMEDFEWKNIFEEYFDGSMAANLLDNTLAIIPFSTYFHQ